MESEQKHSTTGIGFGDFMNFLLNHLLVTYIIGIVVVGFATLVTAAIWVEGKEQRVQNHILNVSFPAGLLWPVGMIGLLLFWGWQMIRILERFYDYALPEPPDPNHGCSHPKVRGARFCPRCGRQVTSKGIFSRSVIHGD